jgi:hypothetical protein
MTRYRSPRILAEGRRTGRLGVPFLAMPMFEGYQEIARGMIH